MSAKILIRPGSATLADWRGIYRGVPAELDPFARADVEAGAAALRAIREGETGTTAQTGPANAEPEVEEETSGSLPAPIVRLVLGLKLASLGQGMSGASWETIERLADFLAHDMLPVMPNTAYPSAVAGIEEAVRGRGDVLFGGTRRDAAEALAEAGLRPLDLAAEERDALNSGNGIGTAFALAGLFEAERALQSGLIAGALTATALGQMPPCKDPRVLKLTRRAGFAEVAALLPKLVAPPGAEMDGRSSATLATGSRREGSDAEMGACLDLLRQAGTTLVGLANNVSENRLVFWQSGEIVDGIADTASASVAADLIALAVRQITALSERHIALLSAAAREKMNGASDPLGLATTFLGEIREGAFPPGVAPEPGRDGEAHGLIGVRRLLPMTGTAALVILIEFLAAAKALGSSESHHISEALRPVLLLLRERLPTADEDPINTLDLALAADLVWSGALAAAPGIPLPSVVAEAQGDLSHLGGRGNRQ